MNKSESKNYTIKNLKTPLMIKLERLDRNNNKLRNYRRNNLA